MGNEWMNKQMMTKVFLRPWPKTWLKWLCMVPGKSRSEDYEDFEMQSLKSFQGKEIRTALWDL